MSLKITRADEPIEVGTLAILVYGDPGLGKTSLGYSFANALLIDFDGGSARSKFRGDSVQVRSWDDVSNIEESDLVNYDTVVVDTAGRLLDALTVALCKENPKNARGTGDLTIQGWGALKNRFGAWAKALRDMGKDVVLLAHAKDKRGQGDDVTIVPDVQGGSLAEVFKWADAVAYMRVAGKDRVLEFAPSESWHAKDPANLGQFKVPEWRSPDDAVTGAELAQTIRAKLTAQAAASGRASKELEEHRNAVAAADTPESLTECVVNLDAISSDPVRQVIRKAIAERADLEGWDWSRADRCFVPPAAPDAEVA